MLDENLLWLVNWFDSQCDKNWERLFGIKIHTIDNPGWAISISIQETELKNGSLQKVFVDRTNSDWFACKLENGFFEGNCGTFNFFEVLQSFRNLASTEKNIITKFKNKNLFFVPKEKNNTLDDYWLWLMSWYDSQCNGDWEHCYGIGIDSLSNPGWSVSIALQETDLEDKLFEKIDIERSEKDWFLCQVRNKMFQAHCGTFNLMDVLRTFKDWAEN
jgi:hypothetical protein